MGFQIAIDGPAGAGKSTISREVATRLSFVYVDTGAMYRAIALYLLRKGIAAEDKEGIEKACTEPKVTLKIEGGDQKVLLDGEDVGERIRSQEVAGMASASSALPKVREALLSLQRDLARDYDVVMDGRDIGTTILPDAEVKIYLDASPEVRATRRLKQDAEKGRESSFEQTLADIKARDKQDMERETSPLRKAEDAIYLDSSDLTLEQVIEKILGIVREKRG